MVVEWVLLPSLIVGILLVILAGAIVALAPEDPLHRALGLLLFLRGAMTGLIAFGSGIDQVAVAVREQASVALVFAILHFGHRFWVDHTARTSTFHRRVVPWLMLASAAAMAGWLMIDPTAVQDGPAPGPFGFAGALSYLALAALGVTLLRLPDARQRLRREAALLVGIGLVLAATHFATFVVLTAAIDVVTGSPWGLYQTHPVLAIEHILHGVTVAFCATALILAWPRHRPLAGAIGTAFLTGTVAAAMLQSLLRGVEMPFQAFQFGSDAVWTLLAAILVGHAVLRMQFLGADTGARFALRQSTLAALFAMAFLLLSETLEELLPVEDRWLAIASAGAIALAVRPLQRLSVRVADRLAPGPPEGDPRVELYEIAAEAAFASGEPPIGLLDELRAKLEVPKGEADRIDRRLRRS